MKLTILNAFLQLVALAAAADSRSLIERRDLGAMMKMTRSGMQRMKRNKDKCVVLEYEESSSKGKMGMMMRKLKMGMKTKKGKSSSKDTDMDEDEDEDEDTDTDANTGKSKGKGKGKGKGSTAAPTVFCSEEPSVAPGNATTLTPMNAPTTTPTTMPSTTPTPGICLSDCVEANGSPGCSDFACNATVSEIDPFCSEVEWDSLCVQEACQLCAFDFPCPKCPTESPTDSPTTPFPTISPVASCGSDCLINNNSPGCSDPFCNETITNQDPFCSDVTWDNICAQQACQLCGLDTTGCDLCVTEAPTPAPTPVSVPSNCSSGSVFQLLSSSNSNSTCDVLFQGQCITSNTDPFYQDNEDCAWILQGDATLAVPKWNVEDTFDILFLSTGEIFSGAPPQNGLNVPSNANFQFTSDGSVVREGFVVCACMP